MNKKSRNDKTIKKSKSRKTLKKQKTKEEKFNYKWGYQKSLDQIRLCLFSGSPFLLYGSQKFGKTTFIKDLLQLHSINKFQAPEKKRFEFKFYIDNERLNQSTRAKPLKEESK
jgi:ABC-type multidrug transport system ATPase subunit